MKIDKEKAISLYDAKKIKSFSPGLYLPKDRKKQRERFVKIDKEYYFCKIRDELYLINEFLGIYFSNKLELNPMRSKIGYLDDDYYLLQKSFYNRGYEYFYPYELGYTREKLLKDYYEKFDDEFIMCDFLYKIKEDYGEKLFNDILKLIAVDLRMRQYDRNNSNITICKNKFTNEYSLAPVYDFEYSYEKKFNKLFCENYFIEMRLEEDGITQLIDRYPIVLEYIKRLIDIPIDDAISHLKYVDGCILNLAEKNYYKKIDEENIKIFKKVI